VVAIDPARAQVVEGDRVDESLAAVDQPAVGEGVASALADAAFCRYLGVAIPAQTPVSTETAQLELAQV